LSARSIHKSQGQTLPRVKVDLGKVFEKGESSLPSALSRRELTVLTPRRTKLRRAQPSHLPRRAPSPTLHSRQGRGSSQGRPVERESLYAPPSPRARLTLFTRLRNRFRCCRRCRDRPLLPCLFLLCFCFLCPACISLCMKFVSFATSSRTWRERMRHGLLASAHHLAYRCSSTSTSRRLPRTMSIQGEPSINIQLPRRVLTVARLSLEQPSTTRRSIA